MQRGNRRGRGMSSYGRGQGQGRGRMGGRRYGPPAECVCSRCNTSIPHKPGSPCWQERCPKCGSPMVRG